MQKLHITLYLFLIWSFSYAQQYTNYTTKDGLPSNHVYRIIQDYKGFIWFITDKGIVKYNGKTFKTFTTKEGLPTNGIWDIRITPDHKVWYFTKASKLGYIENDSVFAFESEQKNEILYPVAINQNKNKITFLNGATSYSLQENQWKRKTDTGFYEKIIHPNIKKTILKNELDSLQIFNKKNEIIKTIKLEKTFAKNKYRGQINDSLFCWLNQNKMYLLNLNTLVLNKINYDLKAKKLVRFSAVNNNIQISGEDFVSFVDTNYQLKNTIKIPKKLNSHFSFVDKNENLWIATFTNGVYFLPKNKRNIKTNFSNQKVGRIKKIKNKLWVTVFKKGVFELDSITLESKPKYVTKDFIFNFKEIKELDKTYVLLYEKTVLLNNNTSKKRNLKIDGSENVRDLVYHNNFLYGFISSRFCKINKDNFKVVSETLEFGIRKLFNFKNTIYAATASGLKMLENDKLVKVPNLDFNKPIISALPINNKKLIIGTDGFGAYTLDHNKMKLIDQTDFLSVQDCFLKGNVLWLATNNGILKFKEENKKWQLDKKYTTANGLPSNIISQIYITDKNIIATSNEGVISIPINSVTTNSTLGIYVENHSYNNKTTSNSTVYKSPSQIEFKIATINFNTTEDISYEYKLLPIQKKWLTTTSSQLAFHNLAPNKYSLQIKIGDKISYYPFKIKPLWFQTLFAKIIFWLMGFASILGIILLVRKRELTKQAKKLNAQKKLADFELHALRSQMNPHFVFNSLNAIQYFITKNEIDLSEKYLVKFARLIRMFFDFSREKEIYLKDEISLLNAYLEIEKMRFGTDFNYKIDIVNNLGVDKFKIPAMLLQPIVENAVNHGLFHNKGKGLIQVYFTLIAKNKIDVSIIDDGVGIEKVKEIQENSIKKDIKKTSSTNVIGERIDLLNQTKKWTVTYKTISENNKGTTVNLSFTKND